MNKNLIHAVLFSSAIIVITGLLPYIQILNLLCFFWAWIAIITGIRKYAAWTGAPCSIKTGLIIALLTAVISTIVWSILFYGIHSVQNGSSITNFQETVKSMDLEALLDKVPAENRASAETSLTSFMNLPPQQAFKEATIMLFPFLLVILSLCSLLAGLVGTVLFGDPPSGIPETTEAKA